MQEQERSRPSGVRVQGLVVELAILRPVQRLREGLQMVLLYRKPHLGFLRGDCCLHQHRLRVCCREVGVEYLQFLQGLDTMPTIASHRFAHLGLARLEQRRAQSVSQILLQISDHTQDLDNRLPLKDADYPIPHPQLCDWQLEVCAWSRGHRTCLHLQFQHP